MRSLPPAAPHRPAAGTGVPHRLALPLAFVLQVAISAGDGLAMVALASRVYLGSHASWAVAAVFLAVTVPITALAPVAGLLLDRFRPKPVLVAAAAGQALVALAITQARRHQAGARPGHRVRPLRGRAPAGARRHRAAAGRTDGGDPGERLPAGSHLGRLHRRPAAGGRADRGRRHRAGAGRGRRRLRARRGRAWWHSRWPPAPATGGPPGGDRQGGFAAQLSAGIRFLRSDTEAGLLVGVVAVMVACANMAIVAEVAFAESVLQAGVTGYAVLVAGWTAGMLAGTLAGGRIPARRLAFTTLAGTLATGVGVALAGTAAVLWQAVAAYALGGLANGFEVVATRSFLNHRAPAHIAGRVFAVYSGVLFGAASIGMAAAGGLLSSMNPRLVLFLAGGGGLVAGAVGWLVYARRHRRTAAAPPG